jgi:hypothetical protein
MFTSILGWFPDVPGVVEEIFLFMDPQMTVKTLMRGARDFWSPGIFKPQMPAA